MRLFSLCLYIPLIAGALVSCRSARQDTNQSVIHVVTTDTVVKERIVSVATPEDSARIVALLRCDSTGKVLLDSYRQECSRNARLQFTLDSLGNVKADFTTVADTIYINVPDTVIKTVETTNEVKERIVEVERKRSIWESFLLVCGLIACGILAVKILLKKVSN